MNQAERQLREENIRLERECRSRVAWSDAFWVAVGCFLAGLAAGCFWCSREPVGTIPMPKNYRVEEGR